MLDIIINLRFDVEREVGRDVVVEELGINVGVNEREGIDDPKHTAFIKLMGANYL